MHKKLGFLVMLVGILALSLAFTGCETEATIGEGSPLPDYFHGLWYLAGSTGPYDLRLTANGATYGTAPYRTDISIDSSTPTAVVATITFRAYADGDTIGTVKLRPYDPTSGVLTTFTIDEVTVTAPYFLPAATQVYSRP